MAASIQDLPPEILEIIFKNLSLVDVENASRTCVKWREISAHFFFKSRLQSHANLDEEMKNILRNEGWTEDCYDTDLIVTLYEKFLSLSKGNFLHSKEKKSTKVDFSPISCKKALFYTRNGHRHI